MTRIIEVIETYEKRGRGTTEDPVRKVYQLWTKEGKLIFENDPDGKVTREPEYPSQQQDGITPAQNRLMLTLQDEGFIDQNIQSEILSKKQAHELISAAINQKNLAEAKAREENRLQTKPDEMPGSESEQDTHRSADEGLVLDKPEDNANEELNEEFPDY